MSTVKKQWDSRAKTGFVFKILPGRHCPSSAFFVTDFFSSSVLLVSFKVNRSLTQWDTYSFPTTGNKFARQACVSQIKSALFGVIYGRSVVPRASGFEGLRV